MLGGGATRSWVALCLAAGLCHAAGARAQAPPGSLGVLRDDAGAVPPKLASAVDEALIAALGEVPGHGPATLLPAPLVDVQLTVGCEDLGAACMASMAQAARVDALLVRRLEAGPQGETTLLLTLGEPGRDDTATARAALPAAPAGGDALAQAVAAQVRKLFGAAEPAPAPEPAAEPAPAPEPAAAAAATPAPAMPPQPLDAEPAADGGAHVGVATWVVLVGGAVVLASGAVVGAVAGGQFDDVKNTPVQTRADAERVRDDFDAAQSLGTTANVLLAVGGAALATGVVLLTLDLTAGGPDEDSGAADLRLWPHAGGAQLVLSARAGGL